MVKLLLQASSLEKLTTIIEGCIDHWFEYSLEERIRLVDTYTERYYELAGIYPSGNRLRELADFLLMDDLSNSHPDKITRTEYPILTTRQVVRRQNKTVLSDENTMNYLNAKYNTYAVSDKTHVHKKVTTDKRA